MGSGSDIGIHASTLIRIMFGIFRIPHIKQFISILMSLCFLLWILQILKTFSFFMILLSSLCALLILTLIEKCKKSTHSIGTTFSDSIGVQFELEQPNLQFDIHIYNHEETMDETNICGICLEPLHDGENAAFLSCMHAFHPSCIEKWSRVQNSCPLCKASLY